MSAAGLVIWSLLLVSAALTVALEPGVKMVVTTNGINYARTVAEAAIRNKLRDLSLPDKEDSEKRFKWSLSNIRTGGITGPNMNIAFSPSDNGLALSLSNFGADLSGDWRVSYKILFTIRAHGSAQVSLSGVSLSVAIALGETNGRPSISARSCSCSVGNIGVSIHGGLAGFIANLFKETLERKARDIFQSKVCDFVNEEINKVSTNELTKLKVNVDFARRFALDYSLVAPPVVRASYLEIKSKGEVYWKDNRQVSPYSPNVIPAPSDFSKMFSLWVTDYTVNTLLYAAHTNGYLRYNRSISEIPGSALSLQKVASEFGVTIPVSAVQVRINSASPPRLVLVNGNLTVALSANVELVAQEPNKAPAVLSLNMNVSVTVQPALSQEKLVASIAGYSLDFNIQRSDFGAINQTQLNVLLREAIDFMIIPGVNEYGNAGIDLPVTGAVKFRNTKLDVMSGALLVSADVEVV
jgi:hypothetical protein